MNRLFAAGVAVLLALSAVAQTATPAKTPRRAATTFRYDAPIPTDPGVKVGRLPNGLTYYVRKNAEPKNRAELRLVVRAGSVLETAEQQGLAHFMEHMAFNGTKNFPKNELVSFLQRSGVRFGADLNAYTSFDETVYQLPVPTDSANVFERSMQILEDWAHNVLLDSVEIEKERGVVLEEWRLGRGAQQRMRDKYFPLILNGSQYANRLPIGKEDVLRSFRHAQLRQFYRDWYRPDLMAVVAVGDFDVARVEAMIREKFGRIPAVQNPKPRPTYTIPPHRDTKVVIVTDPEQPNTLVQIIHKRPETKERTLGDLRETLKRGLFNIMLGNRMQELTQRADPPFLFGYSNYGGFLGNLDAFTSVAGAKEGRIETAIQALLAENERVKRFGFTPTELARAKQDFLANVEQAYNERTKTSSASYAEEYVRHFTEQELYTSVAFFYDFLKRQQPGIRLAEINALAGQYVRPENRAVVLLAPERDKDKLPTVAQVIGYVDNAGKDVTAYVDQTVDQPLLSRPPTPAPVVAERRLADVGVTEWTLKNGLKVVLKPTQFKNDQILFRGTSFGGTSLYDLPDYQSARFSAGLATLGGTGPYSQIQLGKFLAGRQLNVSPNVAELTEGISGSTSPRDLELALQLIYSYFTQPRKDSDVVQGYLSNQRSALQNQLNTPTPQKVFGDTIATTLGGNNPRRLPLTPADLDKIDLDRALQIYRERFANAGDFTFVFVGNFTETGIRPLIERYLGGLPATGQNETFRDLGIRIPAGQISKTVYRGLDPKASVSLVYSGDFVWNDANRTQIDALAEALEIKLLEKLREEEAGVYGVGVSGAYARYPVPRYTFRISFGCAPENVEKLIATTLAEIDRLKQRGADPGDIAKFRAESTREAEVQLTDNSFWLGYLSGQYYNNDDPTAVLREAELLKTVTPESTKAAANQYFGPNLVRFVLLPERKPDAARQSGGGAE